MPQTATIGVDTRAQHALAQSPIHALRGLYVEQVGETLQITGRVTSFYNKQQAQEVVRSVAGGVQVVNLLDVDLPQPR